MPYTIIVTRLDLNHGLSAAFGLVALCERFCAFSLSLSNTRKRYRKTLVCVCMGRYTLIRFNIDIYASTAHGAYPQYVPTTPRQVYLLVYF